MTNRQKVVAIIDDDAGVRQALETLLSSKRFRTESYASGEEFITGAMASEAACLLVDIQLGDLTGIELVRHVSSMGLTLPIIFMTASRDEVFRKAATELDCVAYLQKPLAEVSLMKAIGEAIGLGQ